MSIDWTARLGSGYLAGGTRALLVLGVTVGLLSAHHMTGSASRVPALERIDRRAHLLDGAGPAVATRMKWTPARSFRRVSLDAWGRYAALDSAERLTILKINRVDEYHAGRRPLVVPASIGDELSYSPLPGRLEELTAVPRFILVSRRVQAFGAYEHGVLVRWGPTSTGKAATPTDSGLFFTNWKSRKTISSDDPNWILEWYVNFISAKGVAFHQYELPGRPASHGCVRLLAEDAEWLYRWSDTWSLDRRRRVVERGTPVLVAGEYDYGAPAPWLRLPEDPDADRLSSLEAEAALLPHLDAIAERPADRVAARGKVVINRNPVPGDTLRLPEQHFQTTIPEGRYWYDAVSGAWGMEGKERRESVQDSAGMACSSLAREATRSSSNSAWQKGQAIT